MWCSVYTTDGVLVVIASRGSMCTLHYGCTSYCNSMCSGKYCHDVWYSVCILMTASTNGMMDGYAMYYVYAIIISISTREDVVM